MRIALWICVLVMAVTACDETSAMPHERDLQDASNGAAPDSRDLCTSDETYCYGDCCTQSQTCTGNGCLDPPSADAGRSDSGQPAAVYPNACGVTPDAGAPDPRETLDHNRNLWQRRGITDYTFEYSEFCFCSPRRLSIHVIDNEVQSVHDFDTGALIPLTMPLDAGAFGFDGNQSLYRITLENLFDTAEAYLNWADVAAVQYDEVLGYVREICADFEVDYADDEITIRANLIEQ